jgi:hypothetical protein
MPALSPAGIALAAAHHGLLSRAELRTQLGLTVPEIDNLVKAGVLIVVSPGQYRLAGSPITPRQELLSDIRRLDGHAADESVLGLHDAPGYALQQPFSVAVAPHRRIRRDDVRVIRVPLGGWECEEVDGIPAMRLERALISYLPRARSARFRAAFHALRRRGRLDVAFLRRLAVDLGGAPGAPEMRALLDSGFLLPESPPEHQLGSIWRPGDPRPVPQVWISHAGRSYRLDWVFLDSRLAPAYDGAVAHGRLNRHDDARRTLALAARDVVRIPITAPMLRHPAALRRDLLAVHGQRLRAGVLPLIPEAPPAWWTGL